MSDIEFEIQSESESNSDNFSEEDVKYRVMSIDIGIVHLGMSIGLLREDYSLIDIIWVDLLDISKMEHKKVKYNMCKLFHTRCFTDWLEHTFQEHSELFDNVDYILIERQPPMGLVAIEQLIYSRYRNKSILISPNAMHKYFKINTYDYDGRKLKTVEIAMRYLSDVNLITQLEMYDRVHDITDSICLMAYWFELQHNKWVSKNISDKILKGRYNFENNVSNEEWLEGHRFNGLDISII